MPGGKGSETEIATTEFAARLHDASAGLANGINLLKGSTRPEVPGPVLVGNQAIEVFEGVLANLRQLSHAMSDRAPQRPRQTDLGESLKREARLVGVALKLELIGNNGWLGPAFAQLLLLVGREAIRNVRRHSGSAACRITVDLSSCPFVFRARDWGAGLELGPQAGSGIALLRQLGADLGCELAIRSLPGLGMELVLTGPPCRRAQTEAEGERTGAPTRSVVAEESLSSRRRVARMRPFADSKQQIT